MCTLNKLKNKLHLKKIIDFLKLYKFVVFYHSPEIDTVQATASASSDLCAKSGTMFLVKCAKLRKVAHEQPLVTMDKAKLNENTRRYKSSICQSKAFLDKQGSPALRSVYDSSTKCLNVGLSEKTKVTKLLRLVTKGGAMGSTRLLGCDSLVAWQNYIGRLNSLDYLCLGGIYNTLYVDSADCLQLAKVSTESVYIDLNKTLSLCSRPLQEHLLWPTFMLNISIKATLHKKR